MSPRMRLVTERYTIQSSKVECDTIDEEVIIIQFDTGNYYTLSGVGACVWQALESSPTFEGILQHIGAHYVTGASVAVDVQRFLDDLHAENLIERVTGDAPHPTATPAPVERQPYAPPVLERYSDMQALLVLDPIHEVDEQGWPHVGSGTP